MIIDRVQLAGPEAYLREGAAFNLAASPTRTGVTFNIPEGVAVDVSSIRVLIEGTDLVKLYPHRAAGSSALLSLRVIKEMFPDLFADPYSHRVHTVGGFDDFQRGSLSAMRALEVEGKPTLVSLGIGDCAYASPLYRMYRPMSFVGAAWDLATSRLTPSDGFVYILRLLYWTVGQDPAVDAPTERELTPAAGGAPGDSRRRTGLNDAKDVIAYRVLFKATVRFDTYLKEFGDRAAEVPSFGRPLLRAVHLLEPIASVYSIDSLLELEARSSSFSFLNTAEPMRSLSADLNVSAVLTPGESISLNVAANTFQRLEARLIGEIRLRPPKSDKEVGA